MSENPEVSENKPKYEPNEQEIADAESQRTDQEVEASQTRSKNEFQTAELFEDFSIHVDQNGKRIPPTPDQKTEMDKKLMAMSLLFARSDFSWALDGGLNISLWNGEYIGFHKDIDISVEADELDKLDGHLGRHGYGLFISHPKKTGGPKEKRLLERIGSRRAKELANDEHLMIVAIDKHGKRREPEDGLNDIDVHIVRRNSNGEPVGFSGAVLPKKWFEPQPLVSRTIYLSHPAKTAYYKLHNIRDYDVTDTQALAESVELKPEDIDDIEKTYSQEFKNEEEKAQELCKEVADKLNSIPDVDAEQVIDIFKKNRLVAAKMEMDGFGDKLRQLANQIVETSDKSPEAIIKHLYAVFKSKDNFEKRRKKVEQLRNFMPS